VGLGPAGLGLGLVKRRLKEWSRPNTSGDRPTAHRRSATHGSPRTPPQAPLGGHFPRHRAQRADRRLLGSGEATLEQPRLEGVGIGVGLARLDQQPALQGDADRIRRGVTLALPSPAVRSVEGRELLTGTSVRCAACPATPSGCNPRVASPSGTALGT
jgi:hypothetical protein